MKVVTITSVSGKISVTSVYSKDRETAIYVFVGLFLLLLRWIGGKNGFKTALGLAFTFGVEIMQGIAGSLGMISTVPLVALNASQLIPLVKVAPAPAALTNEIAETGSFHPK